MTENVNAEQWPLDAVAEEASRMIQARFESPSEEEIAAHTLIAVGHIARGLQRALNRLERIEERLRALEQPIVVNQTIVSDVGQDPREVAKDVIARMEPEGAPDRDPAEVEAAVDFYSEQAPQVRVSVRTPEQRAAAAEREGVKAAPRCNAGNLANLAQEIGCTYPEGHGPVQPMLERGTENAYYQHGAPEAGLWWEPIAAEEVERVRHEQDAEAERIMAADAAEEARIIAEAQAQYERQREASLTSEPHAQFLHHAEQQARRAATLQDSEPIPHPVDEEDPSDLAQQHAAALTDAFGPRPIKDTPQADSSPQNAPVEVVRAGDTGTVDEAEARGAMFREATRRPGALILNEALTREAQRVEGENPEGLREPKDYQ